MEAALTGKIAERECLERIALPGRLKAFGEVAPVAEATVIGRVAQNDEQGFAAHGEAPVACLDELPPDPASPVVRIDRDRRQRHRGIRLRVAFDEQTRESDVADDGSLAFRDQRQQKSAIRAQSLNEIGFRRASK